MTTRNLSRGLSRAMSAEERARREFHAKDEALSRAILALEVASEEAFNIAAVLMATYQEDALRIGEMDEDGDNSISIDEWMKFWPNLFREYFEDVSVVNPICERVFEIVDWNTNKNGLLKLIHITKFMNRAKKKRNKLGDLDVYVRKVQNLTNTGEPGADTDTLGKDSSEVEAKMAEEQARFDEEKSQWAAEKAELETRLAAMSQDQNTTTDYGNDELAAEIAALKATIDTQSSQLQDKTAATQQAEGIIEMLTESDATLRAEIADLKSKLANNTPGNSAQGGENGGSELQSRVDGLQSQLHRATSDLVLVEESLESSQSENTTLAEKIAALEAEKAKLAEHSERLEEQNRVMHEQLQDNPNVSKASNSEEESRLRAELEGKNSTNKDMKQKLDRLEKEHSQCGIDWRWLAIAFAVGGVTYRVAQFAHGKVGREEA